VSPANGLRAFNSFPRYIYGNRHRAPSFPVLDRSKPGFDPLFGRVEAQPFLAVKDGRMAGRLAAGFHHALAGGETGYFGYFESVNDRAVASALLETAAKWLAARGAGRVIGPVDLTPHERLGLLVEGFEGGHCPGMPYNPPFYASLLTGCGLKTETDLYAYRCNLPGGIPDKLARVADRAGRIEGLRLRQVDFDNIAEEGEMFSRLHNESMSRIWGFVPLSPDEAAAIWKKLKGFCDPEVMLVAEVCGKAAGICLALMPAGIGFFPASVRGAHVRLAVLSVLPAYRFKGIEALLIRECVKRVRKKGFAGMEFSQVEKNNTMMKRIIESFGEAKRSRLYRIYRY